MDYPVQVYQRESYLPTRYHSFGAFDVFTSVTRVANLATSYVASAGIITAGLAAGIGIALAIVTVIYSFVTAHQKRVKALREAREARWLAFYNLGVGLITDIYGSTKDFEWSHAHDSDVGFGEYYSLGAMFYWWTGGTSHRDPSWTPEDFRQYLLEFLISRGLEPTRFMGYENVALDEELNNETDFVHPAEKKVTAKEILIGFGYSQEQFAAIISDEPLLWIHDAFEVDLPNFTEEGQATTFINDVTLALKTLGLDPAIFQNKVSSLIAEDKAKSGAAAATSTSALTASMPTTGWIVIAGIGAVALFGGKKIKRRK